MTSVGRRVARAIGAAVLVLLVAGCSQKGSYQIMASEPRYEPLEPSDFFPDGMSARPPVPGTVARGRLGTDVLLMTGEANGQESTELPFPATRPVLERGRQRFDIYCAPCHGRAGYGDGMIVQRGFLPPPSYHIDRLRQAPIGHFFRVMTYGFGAMPQYAKQIAVEDRWAIAAYIRALQLSQHAAVADVAPDERARLAAAPAGAATMGETTAPGASR